MHPQKAVVNRSVAKPTNGHQILHRVLAASTSELDMVRVQALRVVTRSAMVIVPLVHGFSSLLR
jgi:hypothetical protein